MLNQLEKFYLAEAQKLTGLENENLLYRLEPEVEKLSNLFTTNRPDKFSEYLNDPLALCAYGLFFGPQTYARTEEAIKNILQRIPGNRKSTKPLQILDLGAGMGFAGLAAEATLNDTCEITAVDHSKNALANFSKFRPKNLTTVQENIQTYRPEKNKYDLIILSFSLNEIFQTPDTENAVKWLETILISALNQDKTKDELPSFILIIEPAGKETSPRLNKIRETINPNCKIFAPCPHTKKCPMKPHEHGYCHDVRNFKPSRIMTLLNRKLHRTISDVKFSFLAIGNQTATTPLGENDENFCKLIGPVDKAKGILTMRICQGDGSLRRLEIPAAQLGGVRRHEIRSHQRGDLAMLSGNISLRKIINNGNTQRTANLDFLDEHREKDVDDLSDFSFTF